MVTNSLPIQRRASGPYRDRTASTAVECAVCLALIVAVVLTVGIGLGQPLKNVFAKSAAFAPQLPVATAHGRDAGERDTASEEMRLSSRGMRFWLGTTAIVLAPIVVAWKLGHRSAKRAAPAGQAHHELIPPELQAKFIAKRQAILAYLSADNREFLNGHLTVQKILSKTPLTESPETEIEDLRKLMTENTIRHLLICSPEGDLLGIISDRDLQGRSGTHARDIMTADPVTVSPETPISTVITIMLMQRISCVPVVEQGRLCGLVTKSDMLMALQCELRLIEQLAHANDSESTPGCLAEAPQPSFAESN